MDLSSLPRKNSAAHVWVDYIELLCLFNRDRIITKADVLDRQRDESDFHADMIETTAEAEPNGFEGYDLETDELENSLPGLKVSETKDKEERQLDDLFRHLSYRQVAFHEFYPFQIGDDGQTCYRHELLSEKHKFYIFLLLASNLNYFPRRHHILTRTFEIVSWAALKEFLPASAEVHIFRPIGEMRDNHQHYAGNLWNRMKTLADDLRERLLLEESHISSRDSGDGGVDLIGWVPAGDSLTGGLLCVFAQCACTDEWITKQNSSKVDAWRLKLTFTSPPSNMVFIPFCFRNASGEWWRPHEISQSILVDCVRLIHFLRENYPIWMGFSGYKFVEGLLGQNEALV